MPCAADFGRIGLSQRNRATLQLHRIWPEPRANDEDLARIRQGAAVWSAWRAQNPGRPANLVRADLSKADLGEANLRHADLRGANLIGAKLCGADLSRASLHRASLSKADLRSADLFGADLRSDLRSADLFGADLRSDLGAADLGGADLRSDLGAADLGGANLTKANLFGANLGAADLGGANLQSANLIETDLTGADLTSCRIHGISAWDLKLEGAKQRNLVITQGDQPKITVDNLEVGQFIYLLLHNEKIRDVIDTITSKVVLILGRFTLERKTVLDALREELRGRHYLPVLFDFDKPASKDLTGTVSTLANMARFIIADLTDPSCIPYELATVVSNTFVPVQPILLTGKSEFAMFPDLRRRYHWVLPTYLYDTQKNLIAQLNQQVISPAEAKVRELRGLTSESGAPA